MAVGRVAGAGRVDVERLVTGRRVLIAQNAATDGTRWTGGTSRAGRSCQTSRPVRTGRSFNPLRSGRPSCTGGTFCASCAGGTFCTSQTFGSSDPLPRGNVGGAKPPIRAHHDD